MICNDQQLINDLNDVNNSAGFADDEDDECVAMGSQLAAGIDFCGDVDGEDDEAIDLMGESHRYKEMLK